VRVRLRAGGICHSDLNAIDGTDPIRVPAVLGHEGAGVVEETGPGVVLPAPGTHVVLSWLPACGRCDACLRDLPHLCTAAWDAMAAGGLLDGTFRVLRVFGRDLAEIVEILRDLLEFRAKLNGKREILENLLEI